MSSKRHYAVAGLALAFLVFHLPYLPASLEDLDSINFALGVREFDVARHQPHPPGYPVFIALSKVAHLAIPSEAHALAAVGIVAGALAVFALTAFFGRLLQDRRERVTPLLATMLAVTAPLYWFTAARPLSDTTGLAAALAIQALTVKATTRAQIMMAGLLSALATGIRSQVAWLTVPLVVLVIVSAPRGSRGRFAAAAAAAFIVGGLIWVVPLVALSGGPAAYWHTLFNQGAEDLSGVQMLWTTPTVRQLARAAYSAFIAPWAVWQVASGMIILAVTGTLLMARRAPRTLLTLAVAFGPYFVFDLLFQETVTTRYALPLVPAMAVLAATALSAAGPLPAVAFAVCLAAFNAHVGGTSVAAYARDKAPAFRMLDDMNTLAGQGGAPAALAMDRREDLDLRRPIQWVGDRMPVIAERLPAPPRHEWLELVKYWRAGGRDPRRPVWFVADPLRTDIDLVQHADPVQYRWALPYPVLIGGVRPNEMNWHRIDLPDWYVGEGWALSPETAGVSTAEGRGPGAGPIEAWIKGGRSKVRMIIGGRNLAPAGPPTRVRITAATPSTANDASVSLDEFDTPPGPFLRLLTFAPRRLENGYDRIQVSAPSGSQVAIEQFDVSDLRPIIGFGHGWHEYEYNPAIGLRWRWTSERSDIRVLLPEAEAGPLNSATTAGAPLVLHLEGESPLKYFSRPSRLVIRVGRQVVREETLAADFSLTTPIAPELLRVPDGTITVETDQIYIPADRSRRTQDRRHLGLRIFKCELRPTNPPAS